MKTPKYGEGRIHRKFAWLPVICQSNKTKKYSVRWLCKVAIMQVYINKWINNSFVEY